MSAGIASCRTTCAAAPAVPQQPATTGGGAPMKGIEGGGETAPSTSDVAPDPIAEPEAPEAGAQPAAPEEVSGGGSADAGGATSRPATTCYEPAPEPVACGQWVPAPVAVGGDTPPASAPEAGSDTPPEPIEGPGAPAATDTPMPASSLPTWPQWQQHFAQLRVSPEDIVQIGAADLSDAQLAQVYEDVHAGIVQAGGIPGQTTPPLQQSGQTTWSPAWEARFMALGLPRELVAEIKAQAIANGSGDAQLEAVHRQLASGAQATGQTSWSPAWEARFLALGLPRELVAEIKAQAVANGSGDARLEAVYQQLVQQSGKQAPRQPAADGPGWNPQVEQAFRGLGMPDEVLKLYAESGAPLSGLEAAYRHAAARVEDFRERGWMDRFTEAKVPPLEMWGAILGDQPARDEDLQKQLDAHRKGQQTKLQKGGQLASSLFPGGRLLQYAMGRELVSGEKIDRSKPMEIGMAALSGLAAFATIRGARNIGAGWSARNGGFQAINGVDDTLRGMGLPATGTAAMEQTAMGATQTWGFRQKLLSLIPGTTLHREVVGLGHAEAAARAFNGGGAAKLMQDPDGALQVATLAQTFDDIKSGATRIHGAWNAYLPQLKSASPMTLGARKGQEVISVARNLKVGNGNSQLVSLMEVGGTKLGRSPEWLRSAVDLVDDVAARSVQEKQALGRLMAGNAARNLGGFTNDGIRPMKHVARLAQARQPEWYAQLAATTARQWPGKGHMSDELLDVLASHRIFGQVFDEGAAAIAALDRSALPEGMASLLDDATASMDEARSALEAAKAAGKADDAAFRAMGRFSEAVQKLHAEDAELAAKLFPTYLDQSLFVRAQVEAVDAVRASHAATAAAAADDLAAAAGTAIDDVVGGPAAVSDAVEGASHATRATTTRVTLGANARGEAITPSGLIVPSYTAPASGLAPAEATSEAIRRLESMMGRLRTGA